MIVVGAEYTQKLAAGAVHEAKMVFNERGAVVFNAAQQHRDAKGDGISYDDNYVGNALAAMLRPDAIEVPFHRAFDDAKVTRIVAALLRAPELACLATARVTYQGRVLSMPGGTRA